MAANRNLASDINKLIDPELPATFGSTQGVTVMSTAETCKQLRNHASWQGETPFGRLLVEAADELEKLAADRDQLRHTRPEPLAATRRRNAEAAELMALRALWQFTFHDLEIRDAGDHVTLSWADSNRMDELGVAVEAAIAEESQL